MMDDVDKGCECGRGGWLSFAQTQACCYRIRSSFRFMQESVWLCGLVVETEVGGGVKGVGERQEGGGGARREAPSVLGLVPGFW